MCLCTLQWFCKHESLDPNLATADVKNKVVGYMWWQAHNCPGYDYAKKPAAVVGDDCFLSQLLNV